MTPPFLPAWSAFCLSMAACAMAPWADASEASPAACEVDSASMAASPAIPDVYDAQTDFGKTIDVRVQVDASGAARSAMVVKSSRNRLIDRVATNAAQRWRYRCNGGAGTAMVAVRIPEPACTLDQGSREQHRPIYSEQAKSSRSHGMVEVLLRPATDDPSLTEVKLNAGSGVTAIDAAVLEAARQWRFQCMPGPGAQRSWTRAAESFNFTPDPDAPRTAPPRIWSTGPDITIADDRPLEYGTIAEFLANLPRMEDVELDQEAPQAPGTALYTTSRAKVMADIMAPDPSGPFLRRPTVTNWILFTPPHPFAPSLLRIHATEIADEATHTSHMLKRVAVLCEAGPDACALLRTKTEESLSVSLPSPRMTATGSPK